jgi:hypothetical protein
MKLTFLDAGPLIWAANGTGELAQRALRIIDDPERELASSDFVRLEVLPKRIYFKNLKQLEILESIFKNVKRWARADEKLVKQALDIGAQYGLNALDALHVAAAVSVKAEELATTEKPDKPIHRVKLVRVLSLHP